MGIGDSKGAFHEDSFRHEAAPWFLDPMDIDPEVNDLHTQDNNEIRTPTTKTLDFQTKVSDHTGFRQSDNIDDQRDNKYTLQQQWDDGVTGTAIKNALFGLPIDPVTSTPLGKEAGLDNIKLGGEQNQNNVFDYIMQDLGQGAKTLGSIVKAYKNVSRGYDDNYDTILGSQEEEKFQDWKTKNAPNDTGADYDLRGAYKANLSRDSEEAHLPDTFKKPSHPTFSDQSKYSTPDAPGGKWEKLDDNNDHSWTFAPSAENYKHRSLDDIQDYLKNTDPDVKLVMNPQDL